MDPDGQIFSRVCRRVKQGADRAGDINAVSVAQNRKRCESRAIVPFMNAAAHLADAEHAVPAQFTTTHWSVVLAAREGDSKQAEEALAKLCAGYWYPLYAFIRRRGFSPHDAEDLTQEFFYRLLDRNYLSAVDYRKGRFRTFLLTALEHFLANEWRRVRARKRGGHVTIVSVEQQAAEHRYALEPASWLSPEKIYEQNCALALLDKALQRLRDEFEADGKGEKFQRLKAFLTADGGRSSYAELAVRWKTTEAALKMAVSRLRARYGELLREEVANTVAVPGDVEGELHALLASLSY
jgi:RNA polymerase sigma factor (sigma-70 family)